MKMSDAFPSRFIKAENLDGRAHIVKMKGVTIEEMGQEKEQKPVLWFQGKEKGLALNKTNATVISELYGDDSELWTGKEIEIYPDKTPFGGKIVDCIRVRPVVGAAQPAAQLQAQPGPQSPPLMEDDRDFSAGNPDDIPF